MGNLEGSQLRHLCSVSIDLYMPFESKNRCSIYNTMEVLCIEHQQFGRNPTRLMRTTISSVGKWADFRTRDTTKQVDYLKIKMEVEGYTNNNTEVNAISSLKIVENAVH